MFIPAPTDNTSLYWYEVEVTRVVDGDTFEGTIHFGFGLERTKQYFRLAVINTPERGQPGYQEAKDYLVSAIDGKRVMVNSEKDATGRYKRIIAHVCVNGENINRRLLEDGLAVLY